MPEQYNILGIGQAGYNLCKLFERYPEYSVYKIDSENKKEKHYLRVPKHNTMEEYENNIPNVKRFLSRVKDNLLVIVGGSGSIVGITLGILEQIKNKCKISILYIKPDVEFLNETRKAQDYLAFGILQNYARLGIFEKIVIVNNPLMDRNCFYLVNDYEAINENIVFNVHMINLFEHLPHIVNTFSSYYAATRMTTLGYGDYKEEKMNMFFELDNVLEKRYYFAIRQEEIKNNRGILNSIKEKMIDLKKQKPDIKMSYGIYETNYDKDFIFIEERSAELQNG